MTRSELGQKVATKAIRFEGKQIGQLTYMFPSLAQATMFAQFIIWDEQVTATITPESDDADLRDNPLVPTQVTVKR